MLNQVVIKRIREQYVGYLQSPDAPKLGTICNEHGISDDADQKQVRRIASKENWEAHRQKRISMMEMVLEQKETALVERTAEHMLATREKFLNAAVQDVDTLLPQLLTELQMRVTHGILDDRSLVQAIRMLIDVRKTVIDHVSQEYKRVDEKIERKEDREYQILRDLGLLSRVADAIEGRLDLDATVADNYQTLSEEDERHREALDILDAEIVGEEPHRA